MDSYSIAITFAPSLQRLLAAMCFGLPHVRWVKEGNFHLTLRHFPPLNSHSTTEIQDQLEHLFFNPFPLVLQGAGHFHMKGKRGTLWIGIKENPHLITLKKEIDRLLRPLCLPSQDHSFHPHITIGHYEGLNPIKLADFLGNLRNFQSQPIEVLSCALMRSIVTPKHNVYECINIYHATKECEGLD